MRSTTSSGRSALAWPSSSPRVATPPGSAIAPTSCATRRTTTSTRCTIRFSETSGSTSRAGLASGSATSSYITDEFGGFPVPELTQRIDRTENTLLAGGDYTVRERYTLDLSYKWFLVDYEDGFNNLDRQDHVVAGILFYRIMPKTSILGEFNYQWIRYEEDLAARTKDSDGWRIKVGARGDFTVKTSGLLKIGWEWKDYENPGQGDWDGLILEGELIWKYREPSEVRVFAGRANLESLTDDIDVRRNNYYIANYGGVEAAPLSHFAGHPQGPRAGRRERLPRSRRGRPERRAGGLLLRGGPRREVSDPDVAGRRRWLPVPRPGLELQRLRLRRQPDQGQYHTDVLVRDVPTGPPGPDDGGPARFRMVVASLSVRRRPTGVSLGVLAVAVVLAGVLAGPASAQDQEYRVGAKDVLKVTVWGHEDLGRSVVVAADGTIQFPLVGEVQVSDLTTAQVESRLKELLGRDYLVNPQVSVSIQEYRSQRVFLLGEVEKPGTYALTGRATLLDMLSQAGGPSKTAGRQVVVVRFPTSEGPVAPGAAGSRTLRANLKKLLDGDGVGEHRSPERRYDLRSQAHLVLRAR